MIRLLAIPGVARLLRRIIAGAFVLLATTFAVIILAVGGASATSGKFHCQCETAVGPDPEASAHAAGSSTCSSSTPPTEAVPTTNPYASVTFAPDDTHVSDWYRACSTAMRSAPFQQPPLTIRYQGLASECARQAALTQASGPANSKRQTLDPAALTAAVIHSASTDSLTGTCQQTTTGAGPRGTSAADGAVAQDDSTMTASPRCQDPVARAVIDLPDTLAAQSLCGQQVDPSAVSPGDLVFWGYRGYAPTRVGVSIGSARIVSCDPVSGQVTEASLPTGDDVRIKRVLGGLP
ncbi:NlpC/P60 family protein [Nocardia tengchongensis]|uniref:NlpC/P60 family protein n=1 Tax=Nocardia tengchongensis TaxID=2055889 RepID=UPI00361F1031